MMWWFKGVLETMWTLTLPWTSPSSIKDKTHMFYFKVLLGRISQVAIMESGQRAQQAKPLIFLL